MNKDNALVPSVEEMHTYGAIAKTASQSKLFDKIGGEAGLLSIMLMARELGLPPMQSLMGGMNVIQGKVEVSPRLMNSMIRKAGHKIEIIETTDQICRLKGVRCDTKEEYTCSFTIDDAKRAGLIRSGGGWEKFSSDMLFARCLSRLARRLFADVISTAYVEGEIEQDDVESPSIVTLESKEPEKPAALIPAEEAKWIDEFLQTHITPIEPEYRSQVLGHYKKASFDQVPLEALQTIKTRIQKKSEMIKKSEIPETE